MALKLDHVNYIYDADTEMAHTALSDVTLEIKDGLYHGEYSINKPELYSEELLDMLALFEADNKDRFELP